MAPGYVIALAFETAGLLGLAVGFLRLRTERRFRAAELRGLLLTGHATASASPVARPASQARAARRVILTPAAQSTQDSFAARSALHRALGVYRQPERSAA